ncbi:MAG: DUF2973 domain-containing protein [Prochlorothrix sp.]|nr:DUF2973 domain-containing protein [Prochlorothrix sp.]
MLHLLYLVAFTALAILAISNLFRSMVAMGNGPAAGRPDRATSPRQVPHPEFLDDAGNVVNEPLLVMRSVQVEDVRNRLDALYEASPGGSDDRDEE